MHKIVSVILTLLLLSIFPIKVLAGDLPFQFTPLNPRLEAFIKAKKTLNIKRHSLHPLGLIPNPFVLKRHKRAKELTPLPSVYDLRDRGLVTPVKNQGEYGTCWAFATYGTLESDLLNLSEDSYDFSENNLVNRHGFDSGFNEGGDISMSSAYLARGDGPVSEECDLYPNPGRSPNDCSRVEYIEDIVLLPGRADTLDNNYLKEAVYRHGAVYSSMYWDDPYYDSATRTYYYYSGFQSGNHAVTIVGWNDNKDVPGAPAKGAWIIKNSWGTEFGEGGYFYISYYDTAFAMEVNAYFVDTPDINDGDFCIYQYDDLGMEGGIGNHSGNYIYGANVFNAKEDSEIDAVSFFVNSYPSNYQIGIYTHCSNPNDIDSDPRSILTGEIKEAGFYTVELQKPVPIRKDSHFCITLRLSQIDADAKPLGVEEKIPGFSSAAEARVGQSFISKDGENWSDFYRQYGTQGGMNVCIKAIVGPDTGRGDLNNDGIVDIFDVVLCMRQAIGADTQDPSVADMNGDGTVDISDVVLILKKALGLS